MQILYDKRTHSLNAGVEEMRPIIGKQLRSIQRIYKY
jgi:hypothetical protein